MAGPGPGQGGVAGQRVELDGVDRVGRHHLLPLGPLGVADLDRDRAALGLAVADAADDRDLVLLELHPGAAAVAEPAAGQRVGDVARRSPGHGRAAPRGSRPGQGPWDSPAVSQRSMAVSVSRAGRQGFQSTSVHEIAPDGPRPRRAPSTAPTQHERAEGEAPCGARSAAATSSRAADAAEQEPAVQPDQQLAPAEVAEREAEHAGQPDVAEPQAARGRRTTAARNTPPGHQPAEARPDQVVGVARRPASRPARAPPDRRTSGR